MARESTVTFEQVAATADKIKAEGGKPTSRAIREALGTGSMATILKHYQAWQGGQARASEAIDDALDPSIARAISNAIALKVQVATAAATAQLAELQGETAALIQENERMADENEAQAQALAGLSEQHAALVGKAEQIELAAARAAAEHQAERDRLEEKVAHERQAAEAARVSLAKAELRLEAVPRIEAELAQVREALEAERRKSAELHEAAAVAKAMLDAAEREKAAQDKRIEALEKSLADERQRSQVAESALATERVSVQAGQARLEAAARELAAAQDEATKAKTAAKRAGEEAAELRGQLAAVQQEKKPEPAKKALATKTKGGE